jgi:hypothetical protein
MQKFTRRSALKRLGVLAGGLGAGSGVLAAAGTPAGAAEPGPTGVGPGAVRRVTFKLLGRGLRSVGSATKAPGEQSVVRGELSSESDGAAIGTLVSAHTIVDSPSRFRSGVNVLAVQTFVLPAGTLVGTGTLDQFGNGDFAITGGTGTYHGARGSYTARQVADSFGGGTAEYTVNLMISEA